MTEPPLTPLIDWAVAARPLAGERVSGDAHVVAPFRSGALAAVIDGLGHVPEAAAAAAAAAAVLARDPGAPLAALISACHVELRKTRGAVMSVAAFDGAANTLSWTGVGNVEGVLLRADPARGSRVPILLRSGVVGYQLPPLHQTTHAVWPGDVLILATDGIDAGFALDAEADREPAGLAGSILSSYGKASDDALVLVVRYRGEQP